MLSWVVIASRHPRGSTLLRHVMKNLSPQVLWNPHLQSVTPVTPLELCAFARFLREESIFAKTARCHRLFLTFQPSHLSTCQRFLTYPLCIQFLAHSFARFCTQQKLNSFLFMRFRTLSQKHQGVG
jgi:hypothetical protein